MRILKSKPRTKCPCDYSQKIQLPYFEEKQDFRLGKDASIIHETQFISVAMKWYINSYNHMAYCWLG